MTSASQLPEDGSVLLKLPPSRKGTSPCLGVRRTGDRTSGDRTTATDEAARALARIRALRIGGAFWRAPATVPPAFARAGWTLVSLPADADAATCLWHRAQDMAPGENLLGLAEPGADVAAITRLGGTVLRGVEPHALVDGATRIVSSGCDDAALLGVAYGRPVSLLGADGRATTLSHAQACAWLADGIVWRSPFHPGPATLSDMVQVVEDARRTWARLHDIAVWVGIAWWKRRRIREFCGSVGLDAVFRRSARGAVRAALGRGGPVAVWTSRVPRGLDARAARAGVALRRVEDGFVRSVGLGSDLLPPSSVVVDARGIYFDPSRPSDLETLLHDTSFDATLRQRAGQLRALLVARGVSKYGMGSGAAEAPGIRCPDDRRVIVVPGQVGDDLSIRLGAQPGLGVVRDNLALVQAVRAENPDAYVIFRPHPDVDAGHRKGAVPDAEVLRHADQIARGGPMTALITLADEVHTMTSLAGFEALLRGRAVTAYGTPFYAGWGLTQDRAPATGRRGKPLHPDDLVAGALVLYPLYLDPLTRLPCGPEVLVSRLADPALWRPSLAVRIRRLQGRLRHTFANLVARRSRS